MINGSAHVHTRIPKVSILLYSCLRNGNAEKALELLEPRSLSAFYLITYVSTLKKISLPFSLDTNFRYKFSINRELKIK